MNFYKNLQRKTPNLERCTYILVIDQIHGCNKKPQGIREVSPYAKNRQNITAISSLWMDMWTFLGKSYFISFHSFLKGN